MSFLRTIEIINKIPLMMYRKILNYKHIFDICRKEEGFDFLPDLIAISCVKEKASVSASVTVEAVLCVPLFLYAAVSLIWMLELRSIQSAVRCGLQSARKAGGREFCRNSGAEPDKSACRSCKCGRERKNGSKYDCWRKRRSQL